jgi:hypothetical protein
VAPISTGIIENFMFHIRCISLIKLLYLTYYYYYYYYYYYKFSETIISEDNVSSSHECGMWKSHVMYHCSKTTSLTVSFTATSIYPKSRSLVRPQKKYRLSGEEIIPVR